jgi:nucleoid DNA-binding protein
MYQKDLIKKISEKTGMTQKDCETLFEALKDTIAENLKETTASTTPKKFYISNFGVFELKTRKFGKAGNAKDKTVKWKPFKRNVK